jgi:cytochrome c peroxidase
MVLTTALERKRRWESGERVMGVESGLDTLDEMLNGFNPGLYILGGGPGVGKTTMCLQFAVHACNKGHKVPSLKGVWYRGHYGHDGSVTTLAEWFDSARLKADYLPSGWKGYRVTDRAVRGHEFGLHLPQDERNALIAFLKTL